MVGIVFLFFYIVIKNSYPSLRDCKGRTIHFINQGVNVKLIDMGEDNHKIMVRSIAQASHSGKTALVRRHFNDG